MILKDAWDVFHEAWKEQREIERKKRAYTKFTKNNLNYTLIDDMVEAATRQAPGFYSVITFPDGTKWEFGMKAKSSHVDGETF